MKKIYLLLFTLVFLHSVYAQSSMPVILPLRERAAVEDRILQERIENLLPELMRREGIDMWLIIGREYNEDPVLRTMLPSTWLSARRHTMLLLFDKGGNAGIECLAVARYNVGTAFKSAWDPEKEPDQWKRLTQLIEERKPKKIAINQSPVFGHTDGITHTEYTDLLQRLPSVYQSAIVSAERLAVDWLQIRTNTELAMYEQICRMGHLIIAEGLSEKVIHPGITTTEDVVWWYRERIKELKLDTWFHPTVDVQRPDENNKEANRSFAQRPVADIIQPGDVVHIDFGISYLRLNTDVQELAYVLKPGEKDAPAYLKKALATGNRLQDILTAAYKEGKTGNQVLSETIAQAKKEGIVPQIYSHPIGYHGHAAGPAIGMWDMQNGVPGSGDYTLKYNTLYAIELNAKVKLPEWNNKELRVMLEQNAVFLPSGVQYTDGRQKDYWLIPRQK